MLIAIWKFISDLFKKKRKNKDADICKYKKELEDKKTKNKKIEAHYSTYNNSNTSNEDLFRITKENILDLINRTQKLKKAMSIDEEKNHTENVDFEKDLYISKRQNKLRS